VTPEEVELLSELTIVIPTYNRPLELERSIEYWRDTPVTVHILDGSDKPWYPVGQLPGAPNISYHSLPKSQSETPSENYSRRMRLSGDLAKTNFAAICGDDDYFLLSGLVEAIRVLRTSHTIDAIVGEVLWFKKGEHKICWKLKYPEWKAPTLADSANLAIRLLQKHPYIFYGVLRTNLFIERSRFGFEIGFTESIYMEDLMLHLGRALCRTSVIDAALWLRQSTLQDVYWGESRNTPDPNFVLPNGTNYADFLCEKLKCCGIYRSDNFGEQFDSLPIERTVDRLVRRVRYDGVKQSSLFANLLAVVTKLSSKLTLIQRKRINLLSKLILRRPVFTEIDDRSSLNLGCHNIDDLIKFFKLNNILHNQDEILAFENLTLSSRENLKIKSNICF
jgi:glycosyltransferase domain-containing protein